MSRISPFDAVLLPIVLAFAVTVLLAPWLIRLCVRLGWVDKPDTRKRHEGLVPLAGGLTIAGGVMIAGLLLHPHLHDAAHFWLGTALVFAIGFLDDRNPIRARYRLAVQLVAAFTFIVMSGAAVSELGRLVGPAVLVLGVLGIPFAVIGITGLTNAFNMTDGVDGLAGGLGLVASGWALVALLLVADGMPGSSPAQLADARDAIEAASVLIGALAGFLVFNQRAPWRSRAAMFLGDGGSMGMGFVVAALLVYAAGAFSDHGMPPVVGLWIAAVPLIDMFSSMARRVLDGVTPMTPDRKHVHHLLLALGLSPGWTVVVLQLAGVACGAIGVLGWRLGVPEYWLFWAFCGVFAAYVIGSRRLWRHLESGRSKDAVSVDAGVERNTTSP